MMDNIKQLIFDHGFKKEKGGETHEVWLGAACPPVVNTQTNCIRRPVPHAESVTGENKQRREK